MSSRLFQLGKGGRTNGTRQTAAMANRNAPVNKGGRVSVASLAAALLTPQITTTAAMAAISATVSAAGGGATDFTRLAYSPRKPGARGRRDTSHFRMWRSERRAGDHQHIDADHPREGRPPEREPDPVQTVVGRRQ